MSLKKFEQSDYWRRALSSEGAAGGILLMGCFALGFSQFALSQLSLSQLDLSQLGLSQIDSGQLTSLQQMISLWAVVFGEPNGLAFLLTLISETMTGSMTDAVADTLVAYLQQGVTELQSLLPSTVAFWLGVAAANVWEV
ncbi:hypothetical protein [Halioxenophilus aromaticivorans]|uniref:Uncharacterized protein n=1 Tax=Halioxenophilus aromaticivorans TaxID=1306992 RepID=A0AAV3U0Q5_9ALTE